MLVGAPGNLVQSAAPHRPAFSLQLSVCLTWLMRLSSRLGKASPGEQDLFQRAGGPGEECHVHKGSSEHDLQKTSDHLGFGKRGRAGTLLLSV